MFEAHQDHSRWTTARDACALLTRTNAAGITVRGTPALVRSNAEWTAATAAAYLSRAAEHNNDTYSGVWVSGDSLSDTKSMTLTWTGGGGNAMTVTRWP